MKTDPQLCILLCSQSKTLFSYRQNDVVCLFFASFFQMIKKNIDDEVLKKGHHAGGYVDNKRDRKNVGNIVLLQNEIEKCQIS